MRIDIACIVEGHGDREAVPILIRRLVEKHSPDVALVAPQPIRTPKSRLVKSGELERAVELAARRVGGKGGILVILDSDDDCPAHAGPQLLQRAVAARSDLPLAVVIAKREFESWFLAAARSIRGKRGLSQSIAPPEDPELVRGAKEWLSRHMESGRTYSETLDQPALAALFDLEEARRADSFGKLEREVSRMVGKLKEAAASAKEPGKSGERQ